VSNDEAALNARDDMRRSQTLRSLANALSYERS